MECRFWVVLVSSFHTTLLLKHMCSQNRRGVVYYHKLICSATVNGVFRIANSLLNILFLVSEKNNKETTKIVIGIIIGVIFLVGLFVLGRLHKRGSFSRCWRGNNNVSIYCHLSCEKGNSNHGKSYRSIQFDVCFFKI